MRVKGHLAARGVEFDAVDVTSEPLALADLKKRGIRGIPVVTVGDRYVLGLDLAQVDELIGMREDSAHVELPGETLVERATRLLAAAVRYARQLPPEHYQDPVPGLENVKPPFVMPGGHVLVLEDGTPYVPHGTFLGLFRHIVAHGAKVMMFAERPTDDYSDMGRYAQFGEPLPSKSVDELAILIEGICRDILRWWQETSGRDLECVINTFVGPQTLRQMLQRETYSLAQHTRQLMHALMLLGIEPDGCIGDEEYVGLELPERVWD